MIITSVKNFVTTTIAYKRKKTCRDAERYVDIQGQKKKNWHRTRAKKDFICEKKNNKCKKLCRNAYKHKKTRTICSKIKSRYK